MSHVLCIPTYLLNQMGKLKHIITLLCLSALFGGCATGFKAAENKMKKGKYELAIQDFEQLISEKSQDRELVARSNYMIGECYRLSNRMWQSEPYYKKAFTSKVIQDPDLVYHYAFALKASGNYTSAEKGFKAYMARAGNDFTKARRAKAELDHLKEVERLSSPNPYVDVTNCDALNTEHAEYSPVPFEGNLVFASGRNSQMVYEATGKGFTDLFYYDLTEGDSCAGTVRPFNELVNLEGFHEASPTFSRNGNIMIFARSNSGKKRDLVTDVKLYYARLEDNGEWSEPKILYPVSDPNSTSWDASPAISVDGTTLYFASNRPGGYGGIDIWRSRLGSNGQWSRPSNLGKSINTAGNDMFPFVSRDGKLYFSSDGHPGLGGLDLIEATRQDGEITVRNLGAPFNTNADDFGLCYVTEKTGYFSSNRNVDESNGDDDIYYFVDNSPETKLVRYLLTGYTYEEADINREILPNVEVELRDELGNLMGTTYSDSVGFFKFDTALSIGYDYQLVANKDEFIKKEQVFSTIGKGIPEEELVDAMTEKVFETDVTLFKNIFAGLDITGGGGDGGKGASIVLEGIYYDFDDWRIRPDAARELDKLVEYLKSRSNIQVELGSHTDARGRDGYNLRLSKKRAESAVEYIVSKGIDEERIVAKGYGETQLLISDAVSEEEHQKNRRTTVTIIGEISEGE